MINKNDCYDCENLVNKKCKIGLKLLKDDFGHIVPHEDNLGCEGEECIGFEYQEKCENCKNGYCKDYSDEMEIDIDWYCKLTNNKNI